MLVKEPRLGCDINSVPSIAVHGPRVHSSNNDNNQIRRSSNVHESNFVVRHTKSIQLQRQCIIISFFSASELATEKGPEVLIVESRFYHRIYLDMAHENADLRRVAGRQAAVR